MCGPSSSEKMAQSQQASLASQLSADFGTRFGQQSDVLNSLRNMWTPIAQAGPDQQGFGANELAALNTTAREGVAGNYQKAQLALNNNLAARGGGSEALPTGARAALNATLASSAADASSKAQLGITQANYAQGRQNWSQATAGLDALANQYDPQGFAGQASGANQSSFNMAHTINQENAQKWSTIGGLITSGVSALAGGFGNLDMTGGSSFGEQLQNFAGGLH